MATYFLIRILGSTTPYNKSAMKFARTVRVAVKMKTPMKRLRS
jgi:hypothetical protein